MNNSLNMITQILLCCFQTTNEISDTKIKIQVVDVIGPVFTNFLNNINKIKVTFTDSLLFAFEPFYMKSYKV